MIRRLGRVAAVVLPLGLAMALALPSCARLSYPLDASLKRTLAVGQEYHVSAQSSFKQQSPLLMQKGLLPTEASQELEARGTVLAWDNAGMPASVRLVIERCTQDGGGPEELLPAGAVVVATFKDGRMTYTVDGQPMDPAASRAFWNLVPRPLGRFNLCGLVLPPHPETTGELWATVNPNFLVPPPVGDLGVNSLSSRDDASLVGFVMIDGVECQVYEGQATAMLGNFVKPPAGGFGPAGTGAGSPAAGQANLQMRYRTVYPSDPMLGTRQESMEITLDAPWPSPEALEDAERTNPEHSTYRASWKYTYPK
jgi:hypothetical protein